MRIVLCDDHRLFAESLGCLLRAYGHEVSWVADPEAMVEFLRDEAVDACLVDLMFAGVPDFCGIRNAVLAAPHSAFVLLTASEDPGIVEKVMACGMHGVALKKDEVDEVLATVTDTLARCRRTGFGMGTLVLSNNARRRLLSRQPSDNRLARFLTPREQEVLSRLVHGETTASLARSMGVRTSTARTHVDAVLSKLGAHSRGEAVAYAVREGLVDITGVGLMPQAVG